jgi:alkylation response protein AidB-like acyl-CoA dehydrogenase
MTNFNLSTEQEEFRSVLRSFAEERIAPFARDVDASARFPWESYKACVEMGLPALTVPQEYGGDGADHVTQAVMVEELARVCATTSLTMMITKLGTTPILYWGSDELKNRFLPLVARGEIQASYCLSEPDAGSDVASMKTRAVKDGDGYVLNGVKYWITNAGISDIYTVFAKTDPEAGHRGISAFVVEADRGVKIAKLEKKLGMRGSPTGEVVFEDVRVPASNMIGEPGQGFYIAMGTLDRSRPMVAAQALGIAQGALDYASDYVKNRKQFGQPVASNQGIQFMIADMATRIEAARALTYRACSLIDSEQRNELGKIGAMAKLFASDAAMAVTTDALQLLGGYGYTEDFPLERMLRDAKVTQIYEGTNQIQRIVISRAVLGRA